MAAMGKLLKNKRAGDEGLAWHAPNLAGASTLRLSSPDFEHEATIPTPHAGKRLGGQDLSPALDWDAAPPETAQLLLVIEDPDAPTALPYNHGIALLDATLTGVPRGGLDAETPRTACGCSARARAADTWAPPRSRVTARTATSSSCSPWASR